MTDTTCTYTLLESTATVPPSKITLACELAKRVMSKPLPDTNEVALDRQRDYVKDRNDATFLIAFLQDYGFSAFRNHAGTIFINYFEEVVEEELVMRAIETIEYMLATLAPAVEGQMWWGVSGRDAEEWHAIFKNDGYYTEKLVTTYEPEELITPERIIQQRLDERSKAE